MNGSTVLGFLGVSRLIHETSSTSEANRHAAADTTIGIAHKGENTLDAPRRAVPICAPGCRIRPYRRSCASWAWSS